MITERRPDWDTYFTNIAEQVASRSTCERAMVGAVLVKDNRILSTGYNGSPPGEPHCDDIECLMENGHCERTVHAETNAIAQAAKFGISVNGSTMYIWSYRYDTDGPAKSCVKCSQVMKSAGIIRVVSF